jgi:alpha-1,6-mannosyltransferase
MRSGAGTAAPIRRQLARRFATARCAVLPGAHETFGLAALEAAACGTAVVTAATTPSATLLAGAVDTFRPGDSDDLLRAIGRARRRVPDPAAAAELAARHAWDRTFAAELDDLERLLER